jgi:hypothetical protein
MKLQAFQKNSIGTLWTIYCLETEKWMGRSDPNDPLDWVADKSDAVAMSKSSIKKRFPDAEINWRGWVN